MPPATTSQITPEMVSEDGKTRVARTGGQVSVAGSLVVVGEYAVQQFGGWDGSLPTYVAAALVALLTWAGSRITNNSRIKAS